MITIMTTPIITATPTGTVMGRDKGPRLPGIRQRRDRDDLNRARRALPADDLAVAVVPGRRILLLQRHRVGGRGRRHHRRRDAQSLAVGHAVGRRRLLRRRVALPCLARMCRRGRHGIGRSRRARRGLYAIARTASGDDGAGPRVCRHRERRLALRRAGAIAASLAGRDRLSGRRRRRRRRPRRAARSDAACLPARANGQLDFRRRPADPARADRQPARSGRARARRRLHRRRARSRRRWTTSAARRSAPTLQACITRRSIRGCSGHEHERDNGDITGREAAQSEPARTLARRHRRSGRLRQDGADGPALQEHARDLRHRRHHQRHLHQVGCRISGARRLAHARPHRRRRDRRLSAHRDPRGRLDEPRRRRRHAREISRRSIWC